MLALTSYDWPGNVRELENAIERAVVFTNGKQIPLSVLPQNVSAFAESRHSLTFKIGTPLRELERKAIDITLHHTRGDKNMAARLLGIATRTIYRHLEREEDEGDNKENDRRRRDGVGRKEHKKHKRHKNGFVPLVLFLFLVLFRTILCRIVLLL